MMCSRGHRYTPTSKHARCPICEPARNRERMLDPRHRVYSTKRWQKLRALVRERYGSQCAYANEECSGGLEVHHIVPTRYDSDLFFELSNLELVCRVHQRNERARSEVVFAAIARK